MRVINLHLNFEIVKTKTFWFLKKKKPQFWNKKFVFFVDFFFYSKNMTLCWKVWDLKNYKVILIVIDRTTQSPCTSFPVGPCGPTRPASPRGPCCPRLPLTPGGPASPYITWHIQELSCYKLRKFLCTAFTVNSFKSSRSCWRWRLMQQVFWSGLEEL